MKQARRVTTVLVLAVASCFALGFVDEAAAQRVSNSPVWEMARDGTDRSVTWRRHRPNPRFAIYNSGTLGDANDDLVLDKETGLVWERSPMVRTGSSAPATPWKGAITRCLTLTEGNRRGFRLATIEELAGLLEMGTADFLPSGHPFLNVSLILPYWSSTTETDVAGNAWTVDFSDGSLGLTDKTAFNGCWCVRGGEGPNYY